jgi:uncharacterized membrane protein
MNNQTNDNQTFNILTMDIGSTVIILLTIYVICIIGSVIYILLNPKTLENIQHHKQSASQTNGNISEES